MPLSKSQLAQKSLADAIGIETVAGSFTPLIPAGTPLPTTFTDDFSTAQDGQPSVVIRLAQNGVGGQASLGSLELEGISTVARGLPRIRIRIKVDEHGWLEAKATELGVGNEATWKSKSPLETALVEEEEAAWGRNVEDVADDVDLALQSRLQRGRSLYFVGGCIVLAALGLYLLW